jgi:hypothetical protein
MHYFDENAPDPIIKLVVYKHSTEHEDVFCYDVTSVREIRWVTTYNIAALHFQQQLIFEEYLKDYEEEKWYLVNIDYDFDRERFVVASIKDVSDDPDESYKLH